MNGISIIICTYNGKAKLKETITAILQLQSSCPWELLVVDNISTDGTAEFCSSLLSNSDIDWKILREAKPGLIHARLCGLRASKYEVLLYCDDDNTLDENYLEIGYEILKNNPKIGALGGCGFPVFEGKKPEWFDTYSHSFAVGPQAGKEGLIASFPAEVYGAGTFFRKAVLLHFLDKGFQSGLSGRTGTNLVSGEDVEWCYLIQLVGYEIWYSPRLVFQHLMPEGRMNWEYYLRLKKGIALGTGQLLPYYCLFIDSRMSDFKYAVHWLKKTIFVTLLYFKHKTGILFQRNNLTEKTVLASVILPAKMNSYFRHAIPAFKHFRGMKKLL